jgi:hypothetical protein
MSLRRWKIKLLKSKFILFENKNDVYLKLSFLCSFCCLVGIWKKMWYFILKLW